MNNADTTIPMATPPVSSSTDSQPQETLLQRGAFEPPFTPGTLGRLDRFEILRLQGEGGMGQVYLAREPRTDTRVAVKIMRPELAGDPQAVHRFLTEARHMYRLSHPRILRVLEVSERAEGPYYVMPFIEGGSLLGQYRPGKPLPAERALSVARQVAEALAHAHSHGLIHRDLKPGNVLLDKEGNAYLTDFGLVRTVFNDSMVDASASHLEGTAPYMSPAVARGEAEDTRCDIYAFGALLYELLAGQPPYAGRTPQIILDQVLKGPPPPLRTVNPKASPALVRVAEGCLARELRDRYTTMTDVVADLECIQQGKAPLGPHGGNASWRLARLLGIAAATAALLGLAVFGLPRLPQGRQAVRYVARTPGDPRLFPCSTNNDTVTITGYLGSEATITLPDELGGLPVVGIADRAFKSCIILKEVTVPASVAIIGREAFAGCVNLESAFFLGDAPGGGSYASLFEGNTKAIVYYTLGAKGWAATFGGRPAYQREGVFGVAVSHDGITVTKYFGGQANISIPEVICDKTVIALGDNAFFARDCIREIAIPKTVTRIGNTTFFACNNLTNVNIHATNLFIGNQSFASCGNLAGPLSFDGVVGIDTGAFWGCRNLTNIHIPSSVTFLGGNPFSGCSSLQGIDVADANSAFVSVDGSLFSKDKKTLLCSPSSRLGSYRIPAGTEALGPWSIGDATGLTHVIIPDSVTNIGFHAFVKCVSLEEIVIPKNVVSVDIAAFKNCEALTYVDFKGDAPTVGREAFEGANNVTVRYLLGTKGWGPTFGGRPTAVWNLEDQFAFSTDGKSATITKYQGACEDVTIPFQLKGLPVETIGDNAFADNTNIVSVSVSDSVKRIGNGAFRNCSRLAEVALGDRLESLGGEAFCDCVCLQQIDIPASVRDFNGSAFIGCRSLVRLAVDKASPFYVNDSEGVVLNKEKTRLVRCPPARQGRFQIPKGVTCIGDCSFNECAALTEVAIPDGVVRIEGCAFSGCRSLTHVALPASLADLEPNAFSYCDSLRQFEVDANNLTLRDKEGVIFNKEMTRLIRYPSGKPGRYVVPAGVTQIGGCAFEGCLAVDDVILPKGLVAINNSAFCGCTNLLSITLPDGVTDIGSVAFKACTRLSSLTMPDSVRRLGGSACHDCKGLKAVNISRGISTIEPWTFAGCDSLEHVDIPDNISGLGPVSFYQCRNLKSVKFGKALEVIGDLTFEDCTSLTNVTLSSNLTNIGERAFCSCTNLMSVAFSDRVGHIGRAAFRGCSRLINVTLPDTVTEIEDVVFGGCTSLTEVVLGRGLTNVAVQAFSWCSAMTNVFCRGNAPTAHDYAFLHDDNLTFYHLPGTKGWGPTFGGRPTAVWNGDATAQPAPADGGLYMVVDLSGGTNATRYPVTYLNAVPSGGWTDEHKTDKLVLRRIEPGAFLMGSPDDELARDPDREAQHLVTLTAPFYLGVFEVTQRQWELVTGTRPSYFNNPACYASRPVESVSYAMIGGGTPGDTFTERLRSRTGLSLGLPSDAQWEYACRAGTATSFGNGRNLSAVNVVCPELAAIARYCRNNGAAEGNGCARDVDTHAGTAAVGSYAPNEWGLFDMHGNVYEWTEDWWAPCTNSAPLTDPKGPVDGRLKTVRGGSWNAEGTHCRAAARPGSRSLTNASNTFGFRVFVPAATTSASGVVTPRTPIPFTYATNSGSIVITRYTGPGGEVEIPATVDGLPVVAIGEQAFQQCAGLTGVRFPASIANIRDNAFEHCTNLASVAFPPDSQLERIGDWAFHHCLALSDFTFPKRTTVIGARAFSCCFGFTRVEITAGVSAIGEHAFHNCGYIASFHVDDANPAYCSADGVLFDKAMKTLIRYPPEKHGSYAIPSGVARVESWAFYKCDGITRLAIPASVVDIASASFGSCPALSDILVDDANPFYRGIDGGLYDKNASTLLAHPGGAPATFDVPAGVKMIGMLACEDNRRLSRVTLPDSLVSIKEAAFIRCQRLTHVCFKGAPPNLSPAVFDEADQAVVYHLPGQPGWSNTFGGRPTAEWKP